MEICFVEIVMKILRINSDEDIEKKEKSEYIKRQEHGINAPDEFPDLIHQKGFDESTMREIMKAAGNN